MWLLLLAAQDVEAQIQDFLREFEAAEAEEQALSVLEGRLVGLGAPASDAIGRRLVEDLRDGEASRSAPALLGALESRTETVALLRGALRDPSTSGAGRIELARALLELGDAQAADEVRRLIGEASATGQGAIVAMLSEVETPASRALLAEMVSDELLSSVVRRSAAEGLEGRASRKPLRSEAEEPHATLVNVPLSHRPPRQEKRDEPPSRTYNLVFGAVAGVFLVLLFVFRRKG